MAFCKKLMFKIFIPLLVLITMLSSCSISHVLPASSQVTSSPSTVEITLMAIGHPSGGKLKKSSTGCAVVHFLNKTNKPVSLPTAPRSIAKGRVKDWSDISYLSPKQGKGYGWGYRSFYDLPKVKVEFLTEDGEVVHSDESIQMQQLNIMEPRAWTFSPITFSTPAKSGSYTLRFSFDNRPLNRPSGHNNAPIGRFRKIETAHEATTIIIGPVSVINS